MAKLEGRRERDYFASVVAVDGSGQIIERLNGYQLRILGEHAEKITLNDLVLEPSVTSPGFNLGPFNVCQRSPKKLVNAIQTLFPRWHKHHGFFSCLNREGLARRKPQCANKINRDGDGTIISNFKGNHICM